MQSRSPGGPGRPLARPERRGARSAPLINLEDLEMEPVELMEQVILTPTNQLKQKHLVLTMVQDRILVAYLGLLGKYIRFASKLSNCYQLLPFREYATRMNSLASSHSSSPFTSWIPTLHPRPFRLSVSTVGVVGPIVRCDTAGEPEPKPFGRCWCGTIAPAGGGLVGAMVRSTTVQLEQCRSASSSAS